MKNDAMVFDLVDPSVVSVAFVFFVGGAVEVDENYGNVDGDGHLDSGCAHIQGLKISSLLFHH